ncbi:helix-turn-helix transcriptional regulator [Buttiauxella ferragutiae]|uniref:helix-turn-helix transcriptional regulator n=1 Tax=Buttiauxella ferragutiae TaxID=82989 RepID=UPI0035259CB1
MNTKVVSDNCYSKIAITELLSLLKTPHFLSTTSTAIYSFEKKYVSNDDMNDLLNCDAERILVFVRKELRGFLSVLVGGRGVVFEDYSSSILRALVSIRKFMDLPPREITTCKNESLSDVHQRCFLLTNKEKLIMELFISGASVHQISLIMDNHHKIVSTHKRNCMKKMGIRADVELMQRGRMLMLVMKRMEADLMSGWRLAQ